MRKLGYFTCSNGYGHFDRAVQILKPLENEFDITIFCEEYQYKKFKPDINAKFEYYDIPNIRWDYATKNREEAINNYFKWTEKYGNRSFDFNIVLSDNIPSLLMYRKDVVIIGSFLWKDVFEKRFGSNFLTDFDIHLVNSCNPRIITNMYLETGSVKTYENKLQFGFNKVGKKSNDRKRVVGIRPSIDYMQSYINFFEDTEKFDSTDINDTQDSIFVARPGGGIINYCVEHNIPLVAVYDKEDSAEIIELAKAVEDNGLGISHNVTNENLQESIDRITDFLIDNNELVDEGYTHIAEYILNKL